jgi:AraC-like DNA-binding protein|tara:strand:+ start:97 stop:318 length:222 start_codon:yes stop_codon:yes gene_type:complete
MSWTNKSLKQLNRERDEIKEVAEELYYTFMSYLPQRERDEFIQRYNHTPETTNKEVGKLLIKDIQQIVKDNWY